MDTDDSELLQLEAAIARARAKVASSAGALSRQLAQVTDWREWIRREPALALGLACAVGFLLGQRSR
jgi:ElaB/YqjD/DUF883 family membrane-anchored ribosome-binding protein